MFRPHLWRSSGRCHILCSFVTWCVLFYYMCIPVLHTLVAGLLARTQYPEGPATSHLDTGFSWFTYVYKQMLGWFPTLQVATACFSCSPPNLHLLDPYFIYMYMHNNHCHRVTAICSYMYYYRISHFSALAGKYFPILWCSNQQG